MKHLVFTFCYIFFLLPVAAQLKHTSKKKQIKSAQAKAKSNFLKLKLSANSPCRFYLDKQYKGLLSSGKVLRLLLSEGSYQFKAVSTQNSADVWETTYNVYSYHLSKEEFYEINLEYNIKRREEKEAKARAAENAINDALNTLQSSMVIVKGGKFSMGCTPEQKSPPCECLEAEFPVHNVEISSFEISRFEVTQALWQVIMGSNPSYFDDCPSCPVEQVSFEQVQDFIQKLNETSKKDYRLPTEAEWEYAARGGYNNQNFQFAGGSRLDEVGWYDGNSVGRTHPVGKKRFNGLGLYDMSGNVFEWCSDWLNHYESSTQRNPVGSRGEHEYRIARGGSWSGDQNYCRSARRWADTPGSRANNLGFRLAHPSR
jgi:formylglycine-generating enzyme required for sulfatase activity